MISYIIYKNNALSVLLLPLRGDARRQS